MTAIAILLLAAAIAFGLSRLLRLPAIPLLLLGRYEPERSGRLCGLQGAARVDRGNDSNWTCCTRLYCGCRAKS